MKIPQFKSFVNLSDYADIQPVFENNYIAEGEFSRQFQEQLLSLTGARYGCFANNGTLAIYLALIACGIKPGDEVIVQDITFIASANAVEMAGAVPVFADVVSFNDLTIDLNKVHVTNKTKALILCHLFGTSCSNTEEVAAFCAANNILLIEDAAQALAIKNSKKHCGTFGKAGTFSFYADKTITTGEGGFIVTNDEDIYTRLRYLRNQGRLQSGTFIHPELGYNFRITDIQAALGISQLKKLDFIIKEKQKIYNMYFSRLKDHVTFLKLNPYFSFIPFRVVIFVNNSEKVMSFLKEKEIEPRSVFYPLHQQPYYKRYRFKDSDFPASIDCYQRGICLPTWIGLTQDNINYICDQVIESQK